VVLVVSNGQAIRFAEEEVRPMGLPAAGVMGIKMAANDRVVGMGVVRPRGDVIVISEMGIGKRSALTEYPTQGRHGGGVATASLTSKTGRLAAGAVANVSDRLLMGSEKGNNKVVYVRSLPKARRATQGQELIAIRGQDRLAALLLLPPMETGETQEAEAASEKPAKKTPRPRASGDGQKPKAGKTRSSGKKTDSPSAGQKKGRK
jgi:DNA gyrase subunit A